MPHLTAIVTLLAVILYFYTGMRVSLARTRFGVKAPATTGHPDFERAFRIHMNMLEWLPILLPSLWLFAIFVGDGAAAGLGLVWIVGRIVYMLAYTAAPERRAAGYVVQAVAALILWGGALGKIVWEVLQRS